MEVLVLGDKGMLGHVVHRYLDSKGCKVSTLVDRFPSKSFTESIRNYSGDFIINCIGAIPQKTSNFTVNVDLPEWLSTNTLTKIVHPGTDCEMDQDDYGLSKLAARNFLVENSTNTKILRASIIGPELGTRSSLFEWLLGSTGEVKGYTNAMWNGITTLEWAKQCYVLLSTWSDYPVETIIESTCLSKYKLLSFIKDVYSVDVHITPDNREGKDKCIKGHIKAPTIKSQLKELKKYYYNGSTERTLTGSK